MPNKKRYQKFSKISEQKFREILRFFATDLTAPDTAQLTGVSTRTVNNLFLKLRRRMADKCEKHTHFPALSNAMNLTLVLNVFKVSLISMVDEVITV